MDKTSARLTLLQEAIGATLVLITKGIVNKHWPHYDLCGIGKELCDMGMDGGTDGFWIYDVVKNKEWYSPKYREVFGYDGEKDYPNSPDSWQKHINPKDKEYAFKMLGKHIEDSSKNFEIEARYHKKNGEEITVICEGDTILNTDRSHIMIGYHTVQDKPKGFVYNNNEWTEQYDNNGLLINRSKIIDEDDLSTLTISRFKKGYKSYAQSFGIDMIVTVCNGWIKHLFIESGVNSTTFEGESILIKKNTPIKWEVHDGFMCITKFTPRL